MGVEGFIGVIAALLFSVAVAGISANLVRQKKRLERQLAEVTSGMERQIDQRTQALGEAGQFILESIDYASRIQRSLLPTPAELEAQLGEVALVWQPKDLVGGDFYWIGRIGEKRYLVLIDCTGHGVPGAFMTIIANSVLEQIKTRYESLDDTGQTLPGAERFLHALHDGIIRQLGQGHKAAGTNEGLDAAVMILDDKTIDFCGARIDLYTINANGNAERIHGSKASLGYNSETPPKIAARKLALDTERTYLLVTDGLLTQIGQHRRYGLGARRFLETLKNCPEAKPQPLLRQIMQTLKDWQGNETRRDDLTILVFTPRKPR